MILIPMNHEHLSVELRPTPQFFLDGTKGNNNKIVVGSFLRSIVASFISNTRHEVRYIIQRTIFNLLVMIAT